MPRPERACEVCGVVFAPKGKRRKFCSAACAKQRQKEKNKAFYNARKAAHCCVQCGRPLEQKEKIHCCECSRRFSEWQKKNRNRKKQRQKRVCEMCGVTYTPTANRQRFCCAACAKLRLNERNRAYYKKRKAARGSVLRELLPERPCVVCGVMFTPTTKGQNICSASCARQRQKEQLKARYNALKAAHCCVQCGKPLETEAGTYCNDCKQKNRSKYRRKRAAENTCPSCGGVYFSSNGVVNECPVCGWLFRKPIEGIDTPPADAVRLFGVELPPAAMKRLLELRQKKEARGELGTRDARVSWGGIECLPCGTAKKAAGARLLEAR